jgi:hypothetical protein
MSVVDALPRIYRFISADITQAQQEVFKFVWILFSELIRSTRSGRPQAELPQRRSLSVAFERRIAYLA